MPNKIISVYSNIATLGKTGYAINLAAGITRLADERALLINMTRQAEGLPEAIAGIDILNLEELDSQRMEQIKKEHSHIVINLPLGMNESLYEILGCSDAIHYFVDSTRDSLVASYEFLEELLKKGMQEIHSKIKVVVNRLNIFDKFSKGEISWLVRRDIWAIVPEPGILETPVDAEGVPLVLKTQPSLYSKAILRIIKRELDMMVGLALGSGAAFGIAHIGVLKVLEQNRIPVDIVSGSSIGALIASMLGLGYSSDRIEYFAKKLTNKLKIMRLLDFTLPVSGILAGRRLKRFLKTILGEKTFEDLEIPVKIMVYDLANRETLTMESGQLVEAVYMSIAVPGIFEPKTERERVMVDGGISDPVPVDALLKEGVKKIIAVNVLPGPEDIHERNMLLKKRSKEDEVQMLTGSFGIRLKLKIRNFFRRIFTPNIFDVIMTSIQSMEYDLAEASCKKASVVLRPVVIDATSIDFHLVRNFIKKGEEETLAHIDQIKKMVEP
ncbi:MAG: patatin-like phospholipase family protein [Candidatus Omnitrophica bacterium]|nr:patatin-like phospholipase family protein [Candidatus Omnitrophota bacterium]MBU4590154.1 patatin-like phospholipase family protein [Candidatus Omnitrophota bacterium]